MRPLFTIITVTMNAESTVGSTLDSVAAQTCQLYEHLIIDGKSTDRTLDIVKERGNDKVKAFSEKDKGIYDAMNKGIAEANGDYLIFLNSGDRFHSKDTLQHYADAIMDNDYPGIVYGQTEIIDSQGRYIGKRHLTAPETLTLDSFKNGMLVCHQAMAVYNRIATMYNLKYKYSADYEWSIICLMHSKSNVYLDETTIDYLNEGATTAHHRQSLIERFKIMCTYYGTMPTIVRHFKFALRDFKRKLKK